MKKEEEEKKRWECYQQLINSYISCGLTKHHAEKLAWETVNKQEEEEKKKKK